MADERVTRLPGWARELFHDQERMIARLRADVAILEDRLAGKIQADGEPDTVIVSAAGAMADGSDIPDTPLGAGALIRFGDYFEARYDRGSQALFIEADGGLAVVPQHWEKIAVRKP
jgi:hypothetical protein